VIASIIRLFQSTGGRLIILHYRRKLVVSRNSRRTVQVKCILQTKMKNKSGLCRKYKTQSTARAIFSSSAKSSNISSSLFHHLLKMIENDWKVYTSLVKKILT
jgi:hypothetical protein